MGHIARYPSRLRIPAYARRHVLYPFAWQTPVLVVPGLHGSGPTHWQTQWQRTHVGMTRVLQADWSAADLDHWAERIGASAREQATPPIVVAHSFGCLATVRAAWEGDVEFAGALLVAPADPDRFGIPLAALDESLPFPSILVAGTNDPWLEVTKAGALAVTWGSKLVTMSGAGHINASSGHGEWPEGLLLLRDLAERAASAGTAHAPRRKTEGMRRAAGGLPLSPARA